MTRGPVLRTPLRWVVVGRSWEEKDSVNPSDLRFCLLACPLAAHLPTAGQTSSGLAIGQGVQSPHIGLGECGIFLL